ncbi:hypothetical protein T4D_14488 [Trichinella pseudospiralis]|uniref:Uncharacterized protein n=1 Tax=Trichinella pseudospiralis TaxID=6337 RepID=A0A0V1FLJ8_TRIPS|nr:hypothetical protein T4D_14488 [Trichinella pseudospiralis]
MNTLIKFSVSGTQEAFERSKKKSLDALVFFFVCFLTTTKNYTFFHGQQKLIKLQQHNDQMLM